MKRIIPFVMTFLCFSLIINAQENEEKREFLKVDFNEIEQQVADTAYYNSLMEKFKTRETIDEMLSPEEVAIVYYGYAFHPDYGGSMQDVLNQITIADLIKKEEYMEAIKTCKEILEIHPVSISTIKTLFDLMYEHDPASRPDYQSYLLRYVMIMTAIGLSGDGSEEHPYVVITIPDEYVFMSFIELPKFKTRGGVGEKLDMFVFDGDEGEYKVWFDISRARMHLQKESNK